MNGATRISLYQLELLERRVAHCHELALKTAGRIDSVADRSRIAAISDLLQTTHNLITLAILEGDES